VRRMVFVQVKVGQQRISLDALKSAVEQATPLLPGLAPPQGLDLQQVHYAPSEH
jgi:tRNA U38,U39,U40 pseudouridine synthase TruA